MKTIDFMSEEERKAVENEEMAALRQKQTDLHTTQTELLKQRQTVDPLGSTGFERRS